MILTLRRRKHITMPNKMKQVISILAIITIIIICIHKIALAFVSPNENWVIEIRKLVKNGSIVVYDRAKKNLFSINPDQKHIPASTLKVATAFFAIKFLKDDYRFPTGLYIDGNSNLYIKGYGDPSLISEEIDLICTKIKEKGISKINSIFLDDIYFKGQIHIPGTGCSLNPYDALNGALIANFNTINIRVDESLNISSAEDQTPLTPCAYMVGKGLKPGTHRINLAISPKKSLLYVGELFTAFLKKKGVNFYSNNIEIKEVPKYLDPLFIHMSSKSLFDIIKDMLTYSNNFIANQLLLTIGAIYEGEPATLEKGVLVFNNFLKNDLGLDNFYIEEASGLSRKNKLSAIQMQKILDAFFYHRNLLIYENEVFKKTGTLNGILSLVGYYKNKKNQYRQFVIFLNQKENNRDKIINILKENL